MGNVDRHSVSGTTLGSPADRSLLLRLYVSSTTPNSVRAEQNLQAAVDRVGLERTMVRQEIVDVFAEPLRAIRDGIIVTPTLVVTRLGCRALIAGDLSNADDLDAALMNAGRAV